MESKVFFKNDICSIYETYSIEQLIEEQKLLTSELETITYTLGSIENELFYRNMEEYRNKK